MISQVSEGYIKGFVQPKEFPSVLPTLYTVDSICFLRSGPQHTTQLSESEYSRAIGLDNFIPYGFLDKIKPDEYSYMLSTDEIIQGNVNFIIRKLEAELEKGERSKKDLSAINDYLVEMK